MADNEKKHLLDYSQEIACLNYLFHKGQLSNEEYRAILKEIRKAYGVASDNV